MFLLNSRRPLVTAAYESLIDVIFEKNVGIPSSEGTGLICRVPLPWFSCHALAFFARGTCTGSWYDLTKNFPLPFHVLMDLTEPLWGYSGFARVLLITRLPRPISVKHGLPCSAYPQASEADLRCRAHSSGTRLLTCFPFGITITFSLRIGLL